MRYIEDPKIKQEYVDKINDYPTAARSIALSLYEFCQKDMSYPSMITYAAYKAEQEIKRLRVQQKRSTEFTQNWIKNLNTTNTKLKEALLDNLALGNFDELTKWLIENGYE